MEIIKSEDENASSTETCKQLVEEMGWTLERAHGYIDGAKSRRDRVALSEYQKVGIDEYALGFRAGYYGRDKVKSAAKIPNVSSVR